MNTPQSAKKPDSSTARPGAVQLRARRSPKLIALGVLLMALGGLTAGLLYSQGTHQRAVVTVAEDIQRGAVLQREHLKIVEISGAEDLGGVPADQIDELVGKQTTTDLPKGSFPAPRHFSALRVDTSKHLVGLRLPRGRLPTAPMPPGTKVRIISSASAKDSTQAVIMSAPSLNQHDDSYTLDVLVPSPMAEHVARLGANDKAVLIVTGLS